MKDAVRDRLALLAEIDKLREANEDLRRLVSDLTEAVKISQEREATWVYAFEGNRDGLWDWNAVTNEVFFSKRWKEMLGYEEDEIANELSEWDKRLHPEDREAVYADLNRHLNGETPYYLSEHRLLCKNGSYRWVLDRGKIISWTEEGKPLRIVGTHTDITDRKVAELRNEELVRKLSEASGNVRLLSGLLPICARCKKIRDDRGYWNQIESYIKDHSEVEFSHGICPECEEELYQGLLGGDTGQG